MDMGLQTKTALVMASSQGLGRAIAEALAAEGCQLLLCARTQQSLEKTAAEIRQKFAVEVVAVSADIGTVEGRARVLEQATHHFSGIDILVTNSGGPPPSSFEDTAAEDWMAAYRLVFESVVEMVRAVLPHMKKQQWGRIVAVNSICVNEPIAGLTLSNGIRPAVSGMLHSLSSEVAAQGITVNNVLSGLHNTARLAATGMAESALESIPMKRIGDPREFAAMVVFLASQQASYITGTSIAVDGGLTRSQ